MKKIVLLIGIIISTLISCSTDDTQLDYNQKSSKTNFTKETDSNFCATCRDSIFREIDSLESEPFKPKKD